MCFSIVNLDICTVTGSFVKYGFLIEEIFLSGLFRRICRLSVSLHHKKWQLSCHFLWCILTLVLTVWSVSSMFLAQNHSDILFSNTCTCIKKGLAQLQSLSSIFVAQNYCACLFFRYMKGLAHLQRRDR